MNTCIQKHSFRRAGTLTTMALLFVVTSLAQSATRNRTLIVFFDGLRPDYIRPELMPHLHAFRESGTYGNRHHSVFPTVTRVNASSYSTGAYPAQHGLMGNLVYFPQVDPAKGLNTGNAADMLKVMSATGGHLLTAVSLGEVLQQHGERMMVFSSGSSGQALMQNHTVGEGATINPELILPAGMKEKLVREIGAAPKHGKPNTAQHFWVTEALIRYGLAADGPLVSAIWYSDPDGAAHADGIGSATALASIRAVDAEFGRILGALQEKGMIGKTNILISTDHGFSTHLGKESLTDLLIRKGLKEGKESADVIVTEGAIHVKDHVEEKIRAIVRALQEESWVGALFTKGRGPNDTKGWVEGTLSFATVHWDHADRSADILVDVNWNDEKNAAGYAGASFGRGTAGHGSLSPWDVRIPLIVSGPDFRKEIRSELPTSNIDLAPTVLHLAGLPRPLSMQGRVLEELLLHGKAPEERPRTETVTAETRTATGSYRVSVQRTWLGDHSYVDFARTERH